MPRWSKIILLVVLLLVAMSIPLAMQLETGSIYGRIGDDFGPVQKALVEVRGLASGATIRVESNSAGEYGIDHLRTGRYSLWVRAGEHEATCVNDVIVQAGLRTRVDVHLAQARLIPTSMSRVPTF